MESPPDAGKETQPDEKTAVGPMDSSQKNAEKAVKLRTDPRERAKDFVNDSKEDAGQRMNGAAIKARIAGERAMAAARMLFSSVQEPPGNAGNAAVPDTVQADKAKKEPAPMRAEGVESRSQSEARPLRPELGVMSHGRTFERFDLDKTLSNAYDTSKAYGTVTEMAAFTHVNGRPVSLTHEGETLRFDRDQEGNTYASINGVRVEPLDAAKFLVRYDRATLGGAAILISRLRLAVRDPFQKGIPAPVKAQAPGKGKETEKGKAEKTSRTGREAAAGR